MDEKLAECVVLADRHHGLCEGIRGLLETVFSVVVMVADEESLVESSARLRASVAVVELSLGRGNHLDWIARLRSRCPRIKVIVTSVHDESSVVRAAMRAGADGFVVKRAIGSDLLPAVEAVLAGRRFPPLEGERQ
jgi:DNA-binding NarL/FixJ family response regulator